GDAGLPLLALSNSIGTTLHMWDDLVPALARHFRVLRFDTRGHGNSSVPAGASVHPEKWAAMDDEAVISELTAIRGIGRWTAE
ncbi:hypothetical protein SB758_40390, partial [Burkholderia sp. SIMBA_013]